mmetsp:Transcript_31189/g.72701  ORF Transcript_31189/g.72701 Transcript_31189/m.72701 type:complete len:420 (+) Transcript_31189:103-1362(+)
MSVIEEEPNVFCNVYDIVPLFNRGTQCLVPRWSIYHTGVEVYDLEFSFGGHSGSSTGVFCARPGNVKGATFRNKVPIGRTSLDPLELRQAVAEISKKWPGNSYDPFTRNCNCFADFLCRELTGRGAPSYINSFADSSLIKGVYNLLLPIGKCLQDYDIGVVSYSDDEDIAQCTKQQMDIQGAKGMDKVLVEAAMVQKGKANAKFKEGMHVEAKESYLKALSYLENMKQGEQDPEHTPTESEKNLMAQVVSVRVMLLLNVAACCLKQGKNEEVLESCHQVLTLQPENQKALYRRGVAQLNLGKLAEASSDLRHVLRLTDKTDTATIRDVRRELDRVKHRVEEDRGFAKRMLGQAEPSPSPPSLEQNGQDLSPSAILCRGCGNTGRTVLGEPCTCPYGWKGSSDNGTAAQCAEEQPMLPPL